MPKNIKRILTPLFFCVITFVCSYYCFALEPVSGVPEISINGNNSIPFIDTVTFESGDSVVVTKSGIVSFNLTIPANVEFTVNPNIVFQVSSTFTVNGVLNNYGIIQRQGGSNNSILISVPDGGIYNSYYGSTVIDDYGRAIYVVSGGTVNIYGGDIYGPYGIYNHDGSDVNYYSGNIISDNAFLNPESVNVPNGELVEDDGITSVKNDVLGIVTDVVSESVSWISSFITTIVSNSLLLVFVLVIFTGLGIGLLRRVKSI